VKLSGLAYAFENLEVAVYQLVRRVAERASDLETATMAAEISGEEGATAESIAGTSAALCRRRSPAMNVA
jgi:ferritin-like metal-binding protein YciE